MLVIFLKNFILIGENENKLRDFWRCMLNYFLLEIVIIVEGVCGCMCMII